MAGFAQKETENAPALAEGVKNNRLNQQLQFNKAGRSTRFTFQEVEGIGNGSNSNSDGSRNNSQVWEREGSRSELVTWRRSQ